MKDKIEQIICWFKERPKKVFISFMAISILSLIISMIAEIYFPPNPSLVSLPKFYAESELKKEEMSKNEEKINKIMQEVENINKKIENGTISKKDSMRIEYLYEQYKTLKNEY